MEVVILKNADKLCIRTSVILFADPWLKCEIWLLNYNLQLKKKKHIATIKWQFINFSSLLINFSGFYFSSFILVVWKCRATLKYYYENVPTRIKRVKIWASYFCDKIEYNVRKIMRQRLAEQYWIPPGDRKG